MNSTADARAWVLPEEPTPIRLMSTIWWDTDGIHDDFATASDVDDWLDAVSIDRAGTHATPSELAAAIRLRDAARRAAAHLTDDDRPAAASAIADLDEAIDTINTAATHAASPRIENHDGRLHLTAETSTSPVVAALATVAEQIIELVGGDDAATLRACHAPGCVLYFVKTHPRREWCSVACGNRARAARHYDKVRVRKTD
ncbi:CGNR zinc finger domain-containing protein [Gryllotalpicola reticulitermitis]|uniref:CGNR zinc finger domain-containing protein n=1 Tax=Gryllotalpicola reticulitermitis TaxID=1184153 RepID=A0ABV8Q870_9MICO